MGTIFLLNGEKADATEPSSHGGSVAHQARDDWKPSGKRTKRGLYRVGHCWYYINADCNGAANIIRKVSRTLGLDLSRLSRGVLTRPHRIKLWSVNKDKITGRDGVLTCHETSL